MPNPTSAGALHRNEATVFRVLESLLAVLLTLTTGLLVGSLPAQANDPRGGTGREAMWYAPTAADWRKPVLIQWQRTWDDAVALAKAENRPILVCVNMDGEIASEHYAGVRYRDPEIAKLYEPYVCVIASVFRHNPRDYDDQGRRIECPRFGGCTCGEHMALEPIVYEKFLDGVRVAPRHIMVEVNGEKTFDVYFAFDTASVFQRIGDGIAQRSTAPLARVQGDRSLLERVPSPDSRDRQAVEQAYAQGTPEQRRALLEAALAMGEAAPLELLRQALQGLDPDQARRAREVLARTTQQGGAELLAEALRAPLAAAEREPLVQALERLAATSPRAQALAIVHRGLATPSAAVDAQRWQQGLRGSTHRGSGNYAAAAEPIDPAVALQASDAAKQAGMETGASLLELALGSLRQAQRPNLQPRLQRVLLQDARAAAEAAAAKEAPKHACDTVLALVAKRLGELALAYELAERAAAALPPEDLSPEAAEVLFLFAEARQEAIVAAHRQKKRWPPQWLADVNATYEVLAQHPHGTDQQVAHHYDFLQFFGGLDAAGAALEHGLGRFPESPRLHERLRARVLQQQDSDALEAIYARLLAERPSPMLQWFAGYAALVSAEQRRRVGQTEPSLQAYQRADRLFADALAGDETMRASVDHYAAMAAFGRSRVQFELGDMQAAVREFLAGVQLCATALPVLDGLNLSGADTARMLRAKLVDGSQPELQRALQACLDAVDPELLRLPDYERMGPGGPGAGGPGAGGPGGRRRNR